VTRPVRLAVVGDALLDRDLVGEVDRVAPDAPVPVLTQKSTVERPGGAALAALLAAQDGYQVSLVTALASDVEGDRLRALLGGQVRVCAGPLAGPTSVKTRVRAANQSLLRIDRDGSPGGPRELPDEALAVLGEADGVLVADYGRGVADRPEVRAALVAAAARVPVVWDPHPRGTGPVPGVRLVTPNLAEAAGFAGLDVAVPADHAGGQLAGIGRIAARLVRRWRAGAVAITLGRHGALLYYAGQPPLAVPPSVVNDPCRMLDSCGAGDRFAATAAGLLAARRLPSEAVVGAVQAASEFVLAGGASGVRAASPYLRPTVDGKPAWPAAGGDRPWSAVDAEVPGESPELPAVVVRTRARGGIVVATGGCFDLLHAGHVRLLRAARALGDCLVVCLNSDESVRRLKGPDRPILGQADRIRVLEALQYVDAAVVFGEDTPQAVLDRLRPDVWAKGGDYAGMPLPESAVLARWGGQVVLLPYLDGHSTTRLIAQCRSFGPAPEGEELT
jgi:D-beta-D-heptose 7-phosphate kinase / D-beta-D-heptose 1-phosphate adenosyltransferase